MRGLAGAFMLLPSAAFACALPPSVILTLPTGHYIAGAAVTVAITALMGAMADRLPRMAAVEVYVPPGTDLNFDFTVFMTEGASEVTVLPSARVPNVAWRWGDTTFQDEQPRPMPLPTK